MTTTRLYGTLTSPYVRRVRCAAIELNVPLELCDTSTDAGQSALRTVSPLWKVPTLELGGQVIFDSRVILMELITRHGVGALGPWPIDVASLNLMSALDGAMDALINALYYQREGVQSAEVPYLQKQHDRAAATMHWVDAQVAPRGLAEGSFSWMGLYLLTTLEWMIFRDMYPVREHAGLLACLESLQDHPSLVATRPPR
jgi:glutathione S-transferase